MITKNTVMTADFEKDELTIEPPEGAVVAVITQNYPHGKQTVIIRRPQA